MDWADAIVKMLPVLGVPGAILITLLALEKRDHSKTREELRRCNEARVSEVMEITKVVEASTSSLEAYTRSQEQSQRSLDAHTAAVNQIMYLGSRR